MKPFGGALKECCGLTRTLLFDTIFFRCDEDSHRQYIWTGLGVYRQRDLVAAQSRVVEWLDTQGVKSLTATEDRYFPHLTVARLKRPRTTSAVPWEMAWPDADLWPQAHQFQLSLGVSDANGALTRVIY